MPEGECQADRCQHERGDAAERALEQDDRRQVAEPAGMPARGLVDTGGVAADGRGQHLAGGVRHEVGPHQPAQALTDPARLEQLLPPVGHWRHPCEHHDDRAREPREVRVDEDVHRLAHVELPEDVAETPAGDYERQENPDELLAGHPAKRSCTRLSAATTSAMSSSE